MYDPGRTFNFPRADVVQKNSIATGACPRRVRYRLRKKSPVAQFNIPTRQNRSTSSERVRRYSITTMADGSARKHEISGCQDVEMRGRRTERDESQIVVPCTAHSSLDPTGCVEHVQNTYTPSSSFSTLSVKANCTSPAMPAISFLGTR